MEGACKRQDIISANAKMNILDTDVNTVSFISTVNLRYERVPVSILLCLSRSNGAFRLRRRDLDRIKAIFFHREFSNDECMGFVS